MSLDSLDYGRFDELAEEFAERYRRGERPSLQEYVDRFPEMADDIREMFPALVEVEQVEEDSRNDPPAAPAAPRQRQIGDYRIVREVGRGGMGVVYEAEQVSLGRRVALKVLPTHVVGDRRALARFRREAKAAARLHHTNIVPVFEVGRDGDTAFYAMQFIQGQGLDQVIGELERLRSRDRMSPENHHSGSADSEKHAIGNDIGCVTATTPRNPSLGQVAESLLIGRLGTEGLGSSTAADPSRVDLARTEEIDPSATAGAEAWNTSQYLPETRRPNDVSSSAVLPGGTAVSTVESSRGRLPFFRSVAQIGRQAAQGLAHAHERGVIHRDIKPSNLLLDTSGVVWITDFGLAKADEDGLTASGDILGTLRYIAPERLRGEGDARADIYGLGLTLYEMLTLQPAFETSDRLKLIERVKSEEPLRPRSLDGRIPRDLETIVLKAIGKDPDQRYATAEAMAEDLRRFLDDEPIQARRASTAERYARWARRHPEIAVMGGVLAALLVAGTVGSTIAASYFRSLASSESLANQQSQVDRKDAINARRQATEERDRSLRLSSSLSLEKGFALGEEGRADHGLLWMLEALKTAPEDAEEFRKAVRWNLGAWLGQVHKPLRISESTGPCTHVRFSPDGRTYATGFCPRDRDRATPIVLWDTASGTKLKTLAGAFAPFVFRPDGKVLFAVAEPRGVLAIELATERVLWTTAPLSGESPFDVRLSPDGSTVLASRNGSSEEQRWLFFLDAATGQAQRPPLELPMLVALTRDGKIAAAARKVNGEVHIDLQQIPSGRRLASWRTDGTDVRMSSFSFRFSADGRSLFGTVQRGGLLYQDDSQASRIWDIGDGQPISPLMASTEYFIDTPAADRLLTQTNNAWLLRRARDGQTMGAGFTAGVTSYCAETHPDGLTIINTATDGATRVWQVSPEAEPIAEGRSDNQPHAAEARPDRETLGTTHLANGFVTDARIALTNTRGTSGREQIQVSDLATGRTLGQPSPHYPGWVIRGLALSPDGRYFATGSNPDGRTAGEVRLWDSTTGRLRFPPLPHTNYVVALAFQPDGKVLAAGDFHGLVRFWDTSTGKEIGRPLPQGEIVLSLAYSPDGKTLAVGLANDHSGKPGVRLWNTETRERIGELLPSTEPIRQIEYRPDGRALLAIHDHYTQLWDTIRGRAISRPMADETSGGFRPDGRAFLTLGRDGAVKLRDATTGAVLARLMTALSPASCAAFRGRGDLVAVGFQDGSVRLCDPATSQPIGPPRFMDHPINKVAFTPDGNSVAGIDIAGNTRTWPIPQPLPDETLDDLKLRVEARTGLRMETGRTIARLDTPAWRERLEQLGRLDPAAMKSDVDPAWHDPMIHEAEQKGNAFAALWHLDRLIAARPDDWLLYARRARAWTSSNKFDKATADYQHAEKLSSRDQVLDFQTHYALDCTRTGRLTEALWYLDHLIVARPDDASLHEDRATIYGKLGRDADRQTEMSRVFELGADEALVIPRAEELGRAGCWAEAASLLARCGRKGPVSPTLVQAWGVACLKAGDRAGYREACATFTKSQGSEPTVVWNALSVASVQALGPGAIDDYRAPIAYWEQRLAASPAPPPVYRHVFSNALGGLLLRAGRIDEAIARLNEATALSKVIEIPTDWAYLAMAHARKGNTAEARNCLERLHAPTPNSSPGFWDLHELALLRSEAESLLSDAEFPADQLQRTRRR